jgi:hypothetical protein
MRRRSKNIPKCSVAK